MPQFLVLLLKIPVFLRNEVLSISSASKCLSSEIIYFSYCSFFVLF